MSNNGSVKQTLFRSYVIFTIITVLLFVICLMGGAIKFTNSIEKGMRSYISNYDKLIRNVEGGNFRDIDTSELVDIGGWIEILNDEYRVVYSAGHIKQIHDTYTKEQLDDILFHYDEKYDINHRWITDENGKRFLIILRVNSELRNSKSAGTFIQDFTKSLGVAVGVFLILFFLNIFIFSRWVGARITNPLHVLTNKMRNVPTAEKQEKIQYNGEVEAEFVEIADSFNFMIDEIIRAEEQKRQVEDDKKKMIVDISHDIKTPITAIQGYARAMSDGIVKDEEEKEKYLNTICMKAQSVTELINLLFEYVKLDHRSYQLNIAKNDLTEISRQTIAEHYEEIMANKFDVLIEIPEEKIMVDMDYMQIKRVMANIITNSLKYNSDGTKVVMKVYEEGENAVVEIGDDGVGIPEDIQKTVFEPFVRSEQHKTSKVSGSGIGLSIVKKIVELHEGEITLVNGDKENRSIFRIVLPKESRVNKESNVNNV